MTLTAKTLAELSGYTESWANTRVRGLPTGKPIPTKGRPRRAYDVDDVIARLAAETVDHSVLIARLRALVPEKA